MSITVKWGREKLHLPLPPQDAKLASLRTVLAEHTALPPNSFKLIHAGAIMKDDNASLSTYGIRQGSIIALIGGGDKPLPKPPSDALPINAGSRKSKPPVPTTEEGTIATIKAELSTIHETLVPMLNKFLDAVSPAADSSAAPPSNQPPEPTEGRTQGPSVSAGGMDLEYEHGRLGELLLQSLLRLDLLTLDGSWTEARQERKSAVREVQVMLDRLDGGWRARQQQGQ